MPCFAQVPVAGEDSEPDTEEAQHGQGGQEGDDQAGDQGALNIGHSVSSSAHVVRSVSKSNEINQKCDQ